MLYRTSHPFFFRFHPFTSISPPVTTGPSSLSSPLLLPSLRAQETDMACVERALKKSSLRPEVCPKATQQPAFFEDFAPTALSVDEFFVDDLLDFSNGDVCEEEQQQEEEEEEIGNIETKPCVSLSAQDEEQSQKGKPTTTFSVKNDFDSLPASELSVPADDLADLEWLSHFVEDSFSEYSLTYAPAAGTVAGKSSPKAPPQSVRSEPECPKPCFDALVPAKARSKRPRTGGKAWSYGSADSSSTSSTSSTSSSPSGPWLIYSATNSTAPDSPSAATKLLSPLSPLSPPPQPAKKQKRKPTKEAASGGGGTQAPSAAAARRCSHCGVQKTPQWRTGPLGAKTLCNACGVRFKSGRLLPEYRPACSPTFSSDLHSNSHRKVLEMRRKKEMIAGPEAGMAPAVQSF